MGSTMKASIRLKKANLQKLHEAIDTEAVVRAVRWARHPTHRIDHRGGYVVIVFNSPRTRVSDLISIGAVKLDFVSREGGNM